MVVGLLGNESSDSNRFTLVNPKSENDVRLQATLANQNPTGLPVGAVSLWTLKDELSAEEKANVKKEIKAGLEELKGKIPGLVEIKVNINGLSSSNADLMLDSTFETEEALKGYAVHPEHVAVADSKVRPYTKIRSCLDFLDENKNL